MVLARTRTPDQIKYVSVHNSAVLGVPANAAELRKRLSSHDRFHKAKGYPQTMGEYGYAYLLYHYAVAGDGTIIQTQDTKYRLWNSTDYYKGAESCNRWGFGILLEGHFDREKPTDAQLEGAAQIIFNWNKTNNGRLIIKGHKEYAAPSYATGCPGVFMGVSTDSNSRLRWIINRVNELHGAPPTPPAGKTATVIARSGLNVRKGPGTNFGKVGVLRFGDVVKVITTGDAWTEILYMGKSAWVSSQYLLQSGS